MLSPSVLEGEQQGTDCKGFFPRPPGLLNPEQEGLPGWGPPRGFVVHASTAIKHLTHRALFQARLAKWCGYWTCFCPCGSLLLDRNLIYFFKFIFQGTRKQKSTQALFKWEVQGVYQQLIQFGKVRLLLILIQAESETFPPIGISYYRALTPSSVY